MTDSWSECVRVLVVILCLFFYRTSMASCCACYGPMSVRLSVTSRCSFKTVSRAITQTTLHGSFLMPKLRMKFLWSHPNEGTVCTHGAGKICKLRQITSCVSKTIQDSHSFSERWIGLGCHVRSVERWHCRWPWGTVAIQNKPYFYVLGPPSYLWKGWSLALKRDMQSERGDYHTCDIVVTEFGVFRVTWPL